VRYYYSTRTHAYNNYYLEPDSSSGSSHATRHVSSVLPSSPSPPGHTSRPVATLPPAERKANILTPSGATYTHCCRRNATSGRSRVYIIRARGCFKVSDTNRAHGRPSALVHVRTRFVIIIIMRTRKPFGQRTQYITVNSTIHPMAVLLFICL
jgi:hypothetical protein